MDKSIKVSTAPVYLLDDDEIVLDFLCRTVRMANRTARPYANAHDFFEQVDSIESAALIVLDLQMPDMDGIEVMRRLSRMAVKSPLILISGHDQSILHSAEKLARSQNLNLLASMCKPLIPADLIKLLESLPNHGLSDAPPLGLLSADDAVANKLLAAIHQGELFMVYQPQLSLADDALCSVEALVRWRHPEKGVIGPEHFIEQAEQSGIVEELTQWVLEEVIGQIRDWASKKIEVMVSINVSARDLGRLDFPEFLVGLLDRFDVGVEQINLEVTESALMKQPVISADVLTRLRLKGLGLSIDDFGTGYSSLIQLHRQPFSELKIDRVFVQQLTTDEEAKAIVRSCIVLGHELKMRTVAEGVEDVEQLEMLRVMGCDVAQGYLIGLPVSASELELQLQHESVVH